MALPVLCYESPPQRQLTVAVRWLKAWQYINRIAILFLIFPAVAGAYNLANAAPHLAYWSTGEAIPFCVYMVAPIVMLFTLLWWKHICSACCTLTLASDPRGARRAVILFHVGGLFLLLCCAAIVFTILHIQREFEGPEAIILTPFALAILLIYITLPFLHRAARTA